MKKRFSLFVAGALILGGVFINKVEALSHYHYNGPDGKEEVLLFAQNFTYDKGYVMEIHHNGNETKLAYLGKWERQPAGYIGIKYDTLRVMKGDNKVVKERHIDLERKLLKKNNSLQIITPDNSNGNVYNMHEYVWGNDKNFASYLLKQTLNQFGAQTEVNPIAPALDKLDKEALAIVNRNSQRAEGEGFWFNAKDAKGNTVGTYYVETDPVAIYLRDGAYLGLLGGAESQPIPMQQKSLSN